EFLNEAWEPFYCLDVAEQLEEAGVVYLGSATLTDNHPQLLIDEATLRTLAHLRTAPQRRLALDFATQQRFRRDVFWKAGPLAAGALERVWIGCSGDPRRWSTQVKVPRGIIHFREAFTTRLAALLDAGPL